MSKYTHDSRSDTVGQTNVADKSQRVNRSLTYPGFHGQHKQMRSGVGFNAIFAFQLETQASLFTFVLLFLTGYPHWPRTHKALNQGKGGFAKELV